MHFNAAASKLLSTKANNITQNRDKRGKGPKESVAIKTKIRTKPPDKR